MSLKSKRSWSVSLALVACVLVSGAALPVLGEEAPGFAEVTPEERALTTLPNAPDARAVYLFREGRVTFAFKVKLGVHPRVEVVERLKILTEQGKDLAQLDLVHSRYMKLDRLVARTVSPDGTVTAVPDSAIFRQSLSDRERSYRTRVAFPRVEVGAILDYRYELAMDSMLFLEPWTFQASLPVLRSTVVFEVPQSIQATKAVQNPLQLTIAEAQASIDRGTEWRFAASDVPPLVEEPFGAPAADLASTVAVVPAAVEVLGSLVPSQGGWSAVLRVLVDSYAESLPGERFAKRRVDQILAGVPPTDASARARRLFYFIRDEIGEAPGGGVFLEKGAKLEAAFKRGTGSRVEKALMLHALLQAADIETGLVVAAPLEAGTLRGDVAAIWQLERLLVTAMLDGQVTFLDPGTSCLGFGHLSPPFQGASALPVRTRNVIKLPVQPTTVSSRTAKLELVLDEAGRLGGSGAMELRGLHAYRLCQRLEDADAPEAELKRWLEEELGSFQASEVRYTPAGTGEKAQLSWRMEQREEAVLGDETSFEPSRPWGPSRQLLVQPPEERRSDVRLPFAGSEEVSMVLTWPDSWEAEAQPEDLSLINMVGEAHASGRVDSAARQLRYERRVVIQDARLGSKIEYTAGRKLFADLEAHDAQAIVLVRR